MPTFEAHEKNPAKAKAKADDGPPRCADSFLANSVDGVSVILKTYRHKDHTVLDVCRPGYFNAVREDLAQQLRVNAEVFIMAILGNRADGLTVVNLNVIEATFDRNKDVMVAKGDVKHYTPVRHDGGAVKPKAAA